MKRSVALAGFLAAAGIAGAQNIPVLLTGFNEDCIADGAPLFSPNPAAIQATTTTTLDGIYVYFAQGLDGNSPSTGLPTGGSFLSQLDGTTLFQLAPYTGNNTLLLHQAGGATSGTLSLTTPGRFNSLSFLVTGLNGSQPTGYSLNFAGGATTTGTFTSADNFGNPGFALSGFGRVDRNNDGVFDSIGSTNPRMYQIDVSLVPLDRGRTLQSVTFTNMETSGTNFHNVAVFGMSGVAAVPEPASMLALGIGAAALLRRRRR